MLASRTTSTNAWKPAPDGGTANASRAARWEAASPTSSKHGGDRSGDKSPGSKSGKASGSGKSPHGGTTTSGGKQVRLPGGMSPGKKGGGTPVKKKLEFLQEEDDDFDPDFDCDPEFFEKWFKGSSGQPPSKGKLHEWCADTDVRTGMSHPPQSPKVCKDLLQYLKVYKVPSRLDASTRAASPSQKSSPRSDASRSPPTSRGASRSPGRGVRTPNGQMQKRSLQGLAGAGKSLLTPFSPTPGERNLGDESARTRRSTLTESRGSTVNLSKQNKVSKKEELMAWLKEMKEELEGNQRMISTEPGEGEFHRWVEGLSRESRQHSYVLSRWDAADLGDLCLMHNKIRRAHSSAPDLKLKALPSQNLQHYGKAMRTMTDMGKGYSADAWATTSETDGTPAGSRGAGPASKSSPELRQKSAAAVPMSPTRMRRMAETALSDCGPHRLQQLAKASGVSVVYCAGPRTL
eukprot:TRINITY_DN9504_c0_g1_i1.p1 TRINITY_DN9504_c0_g1~~TRINITY_DN9504_c0_g1_i1.p1  ORF type:complete len:462 (-),score=116.54 TRINITY_DN9504_c0_g1_i1:127-1512(-)